MSGRVTLRSAETVIVDEIHALAPNKRGAASASRTQGDRCRRTYYCPACQGGDARGP